MESIKIMKTICNLLGWCISLVGLILMVVLSVVEVLYFIVIGIVNCVLCLPLVLFCIPLFIIGAGSSLKNIYEN